MLKTLLASNSAPIVFSRFSRSALTRRAAGSPARARAAIALGDAAVIAVSVAEVLAEHISSSRIESAMKVSIA